MKTRLVIYNMQDKVYIIQAGAQDTDVIKKGLLKYGVSKVSCVSSMLSMTFLWQSSEILDRFCNTINDFLEDNGYFIFLVMDGDLAKQLFRPAFLTQTIIGHDYNLTDISFGDTCKMTWLGDRKIRIHINESIVTEQDEWLVTLDDLYLRLSKLGFRESIPARADKERLMPIDERGFSSLFTYGSYQKVSKMNVSNYYDLTPVATKIPYLNFETDRAEGDGNPYQLNCSWYNGIIAAVTTIGDGSCFFHALSRDINGEYQETESLNDKLNIVTGLRSSLSRVLSDIDPLTGRKYYYETAYPDFAKSNPFYSFESITKRIADPREYAGDFVYGLIPKFMNIDLIVFEYKNDDLIPHIDTIEDGSKPIVCIVAYDSHFESLVEFANDAYSSVFNIDSSFIQAYLSRKTKKH
jgi:hypothetical protein